MNELNPIEEKELLIRLQAGDGAAFESIYLYYSTPIITHLIRLLKSDALAQEVAQDTFMAVWEYRSTIDPDKSFRSYLYKIATNKTYNIFRRAAHDQRLRAYMLPALEQGYDHIESYIYDKENQDLLNELLVKMPDKQREVFTLFKIEGYSYNEISERLGISHSTINTHISRANKFIQSQILNNPRLMSIFLFSLFGSFSEA